MPQATTTPAETHAEFRARERLWNSEVIAEFRANAGEVAAPYPDPPPMLLLHTIGAKSGREHVVPMRAMPDGEDFHVFASAHGSGRHPDWHYNLIAHPDIDIEVGGETIPVRAVALGGPERAAVFARQAARFPIFAEYERTLGRTIPVFRLERRPAEWHVPGTIGESPLQQVEREILGWPGVSKQTFAGGQAANGFQVPPAVMYRFGRRELGHIHVTGHADLPFPRRVHDELIGAGRASPHPAGFAGVVTIDVRSARDVPGVVELFRMNYERAQAAARPKPAAPVDDRREEAS